MEQINTTLYTLNKDGSTQQWKVFVEGEKIIVEFGRVDGKLQIKETIAKPKNVGRSNETTAPEQAIKEASSKWEKQVRLGYSESVEGVSQEVISPMLAKDATKVPHLIKYPCYVQPKLDGLRALNIFENGKLIFQSRGNKEYQLTENIKNDLSVIWEELEKLDLAVDIRALDGEIYKHGCPLQNIVSLTKKHKEGSEELEYWIFDVVIEDLKFGSLEGRMGILLAVASIIQRCKLKYVKTVQTTFCNTPERKSELLNKFIEDGYEGIIIRNLSGEYELNQRSSDLLKEKLMKDEEAYVKFVEEDKNGEGVLYCSLKNGVEFKCKMKGTHEQRLFSEQNKLVGKFITFKYQALTVDGVPQFPVGICERDVDQITWEVKE